MNKKIILILIVAIIILGIWYLLPSSSEQEVEVDNLATDYKNATYVIGGESVTLIDGKAEKEIASDSASKLVTTYFGNELYTDLDGDGVEDVVFLLTQNSGGSGTFFYAVGALKTEEGWVGSHGVLLGDRVAPQSTDVSQNSSHKNVVVVNYVDRNPGEPMTEQPSVGKSIWLKLDKESMQFGQVEPNFEGEADPNVMTLDMKGWTWVETKYNNDTEVTPTDKEAFVITFKNDGTFSATTDCNLMNGSYEVDGKSISFGKNIAMTKKFCENTQEQVFASILPEIQSFFFTSRGELIFELKLDSGSVKFK